jgi:hypothetical protein
MLAVAATWAASLLKELGEPQPDRVKPFLGAVSAQLRALSPLPVPELKAPPETLLEPSAWDPEDRPLSAEELDETIMCTPETIDGSQVRALMYELIRRAAHDWVLYRTSTRLELRDLAHDAYIWLFEEEPDQPIWEVRKRDGKLLTSLYCICEVLELDVEFVREHVRQMTPKKIKTAGRPPERRKKQAEDVSYYNEHAIFTSYEVADEENTP